MKKHGLILGVLGLIVAAGGAFIGTKAYHEMNKANANTVDGIELVMTPGDSTSSSRLYYSQSGTDLGSTRLSYSAHLKSTNTSHFTVGGASTSAFTVQEDSANKLYNYSYIPFFVYPRGSGYSYMEPMKRYTMTVSFTLTLNKSASGGEARAFAELFALGRSDSTTSFLHPNLVSGGFDTNENNYTGNYGSNYNNAITDSDSIGCWTKTVNTNVTDSFTKTIVFDNPATSSNVARYQMGLFVGCNYASGKDHQTIATVTYTINSITKENIVATIGSNSYTSLSSAISAASTGNTVKLTNNTTTGISGALAINKNITLDLNGKTLSTYSKDSYIQIINGSTVTINGNGGTIDKNFANSSSDTSIITMQSNTNLTLNNVTVNKLTGPSATITMSSGSLLTCNSTTTIYNSSSYVSGYGISAVGTVTLNGSTVTASTASAVYLNGACSLTVNGGLIRSSSAYAIESGSTGSKTIYLTGSPTLNSVSGKAHIGLYANSGTINANGLTKAVTVDIVGGYFSAGSNIVTNDASSKVTINSTPATGYEYYRNGSTITYRLKQYTVTFNPNGGTGSSISYTKSHGTSYSLPNAVGLGFDAPAYHTFSKWNTAANGSGTNYNAGQSYSITSNLTLYAVWTQTDANKYDEFRITKLHMEDYTTEKGWCLDSDEHHYYQDAKSYFENNFTSTQRKNFANNYTEEWARFNAWATANGDKIVYQNSDYVIQQSSRLISFNSNGNVTNVIIVAVVIGALSIAGSAFILYRKRKHQ